MKLSWGSHDKIIGFIHEQIQLNHLIIKYIHLTNKKIDILDELTGLKQAKEKRLNDDI